MKRQTFSFAHKNEHAQEDVNMVDGNEDDHDDDEFSYSTHSKKAKISHGKQNLKISINSNCEGE